MIGSVGGGVGLPEDLQLDPLLLNKGGDGRAVDEFHVGLHATQKSPHEAWDVVLGLEGLQVGAGDEVGLGIQGLAMLSSCPGVYFL